MYPSEPPQQTGSAWDRPSTTGTDVGRRNSALPEPPTYVPPPVPPQTTLFELNRPQRQWFRIPSEKPVVTLVILGSLVAAFLLTILVGGSINATENSDVLIRMGAKVNALVVQGDWWR